MNSLASTCCSIWRFHRLVATILILEYALAFAIVLIAVGALATRAQAVRQNSGMLEDGLYILEGTGTSEPLHRFQLLAARYRFAAAAGSDHVALGSSVPFLGRGALGMPIAVTAGASDASGLQANGYEGDEHLASVMGVKLVQGRLFGVDEIVRRYGDAAQAVILSESLARRLFHGKSAIGRQVAIAGRSHTVVGTLQSLAAPQYLGMPRTDYTFLLPKLPGGEGILLIRYGGTPAALDETLAALRKQDTGKVNWSLTSYRDIRSSYFEADREAVLALMAVVGVVLLTALCGTLGLTHYWIARRRQQISIRRTLGATRLDIFLQFLGESVVLVAIGLAVGVALYMLSVPIFPEVRVPFGSAAWLLAAAVTAALSALAVFASLRRWLQMSPIELMRAP